MKGSYTVKVRNRRVTFSIQLDRNITIICGDSATGKTTLINFISFYEELGDKSGVTIESPKECHTLRGKDWFSKLQEKISDSFVFIDEGNEFISSNEFAVAIQNTDNYYIFVTRENLFQIPYSVNSVLELRKTTSRFKHTYNRTYPVYDRVEWFSTEKQEVNTYITEDSNSGNELFSFIADRSGIKCISAKGKSNILTKMKEYSGGKTLVIADGAAFGANMAEVYNYIKRHPEDVFIYLPESFEWLLLASKVVNDKEIEEILKSPSDYIESKTYFSWEQFFTELLVTKTKDTVAKYNKKKLNKYYLQEKNVEKVINTVEKGF